MASKTTSFAFISYAHDNGSIVFPVIDEIVGRGYAVWYDKGINVSSAWTDEVGRAIIECDAVVAFISKESVASKYVRSEIEFALNQSKRIIPVYLDGIEVLPPGLALGLNVTQGVMGKKSAVDIASQICAGLEFSAVERQSEAKKQQDFRKSRNLFTAKIAAAVCVAVLVVGGLVFFKSLAKDESYRIVLNKSVYLPAEPIVISLKEVTQEMIDNRAIVGVWKEDEKIGENYEWYAYIDGLEADGNLLRAPIRSGDYEARAYASIKVNAETFRYGASFSVAKNSLGVFQLAIDASEYAPKAPIGVTIGDVPQDMVKDTPIVGIYRAKAPSSELIEYAPIASAFFNVNLAAPEEEGEYEIRAYSNSEVKSAEALVALSRFSVVDR
ncbi:MAG: toll/interleukin-1 receptor domain-containing protein [Helicobacteraceae bacterium]|jgi:hypothetical protein|nr:toll/interleukin-1 receptor domain-containing protein [Helicobacteraceae bacterium]